jgi:uncharacterized RDD family membrane protein YckC
MGQGAFGSPFPPPGQYAPVGGARTANGTPLASWGVRFGGYLIDVVIFFVVQLILGAIFRPTNALVFTMSMTTNGTTHTNRISLLSIIITAVLAIIYSTLLCGSARGQTVGMMVVKVRAVRADTEGALGYGKAFGRSLLEQVLRPTVAGWLLDGLFPLWDPRRQTIHDKASGAIVVQAVRAPT